MKTGLLVRHVQEYMRIHRMAEKGDSILAAVSGGADSVCLLWILQELSQTMGFRLAAFHLNHGLRGEDADDVYTLAVHHVDNVLMLGVHRRMVCQYSHALMT